MGIVSFLTEVEQGRGDPEVFVAAARGPDLAAMGHATGSEIVGSGAGLTWEAARGAAVGECLERYSSALVDPPDGLRVASYTELLTAGWDAHDPAAWALFDDSQDVPYAPFSADRRVAWVQGWDLRSGQPLLVPACFAYLSSSPVLTEVGAAVIGPSVSTGCACARSLREAVFKGLCELVERDAFMIVWRSRLPVPEVVIDEGSPLHETFRARFARPGLEYRLYCTTMDLPMPSFLGVLADHRGGHVRRMVGGAAHPDAGRAVLKTLCELVQGLAWLEHMGAPGHSWSADFSAIRTFTDRAVLYAFHPPVDAFPFLDDGPEPVSLSDVAASTAAAPADLDGWVDLLLRRGFRPGAVDLTPSDVRACGLAVTRVVVPGLVTMDGDHRLQMLGGNRWRRVPKQLGLADREPVVSDVNPYPHPYP